MAEIKALSENSSKAVNRVLSQQGEAKRWNGTAHAAALGYLAEEYFSGKAKHGTSGTEKRKGFFDELNTEVGWLYASNMKKRLEDLKLIPKVAGTNSEYE